MWLNLKWLDRVSAVAVRATKDVGFGGRPAPRRIAHAWPNDQFLLELEAVDQDALRPASGILTNSP